MISTNWLHQTELSNLVQTSEFEIDQHQQLLSRLCMSALSCIYCMYAKAYFNESFRHLY